MRIAFDGTTLRPGRTGVGYYTEHLLHHVVAEGPEHDVVVVSNRRVDTTRPLPDTVRVDGAAWRTPRMVWMHTVAPRLLRRLQPDVVHFTNGMMPLTSPVPTVVTIHDMSLTLHPRCHPPRRVLLNRPFVDLAARRADAIITVSHAARHDIVRHYGLAEDRVHVVAEAAAPQFRPVRDVGWLDAVRKRYALADRFILYVGTIEPRKNLRTLLEAFALRSRTGDLPHQLVCVGPYGWLCRDIEESIERLGIEDSVRFTGYVPFDHLPGLYNLAEMFVFPSMYEGFGLPVIEAMACGTPVITGRVPALVEVGGNATEQVELLTAQEIGDAMVRLGASRDRRSHLAALGLQRAAQFSWQRAARETLEVYRRAARGLRGAEGVRPAAFREVAAEPLAGVRQSEAAAGETVRPTCA
jgi:glycosyltransferase involved in cell wall biosynthesis